MQQSPLISLLGSVLIAASLFACVPEGSDGDSKDNDDAPDEMVMGSGGADDPDPTMGPDGEDDALGTLGAGCGVHRDCESGFCVAGLPGGYCTQACQSDDDCGAEGSCWALGGAQRLCLLNCEDNSDCREDEGYVCDGDNTCALPRAGSGGGGGGGPGMGSSPGVPVGETVEDFSLINCSTGEPVSMRAYFAEQRAGLLVLTAGWCGACSSWIPQVLGFMSQPQYDGLKTAFVLGENRSRQEPTLRECEQYGRGLGVPEENMFMDHNGTNAFRTVFEKMMLYTGEGGAFGLPWNGLLDPTDWEYVYSDGGPGGDLSTAFQNLLR